MRRTLSERDRQLLARRFRIREPEKYPGLTERLEKGAVPVRILHEYDETPPGGRKAGHKPHVRCCFGHPHWHGYVVEFEDGSIGLLGENCARRDFGNDVIDAIKGVFDAERDRQYQINRLFAIRAAMPAALGELRKLAGDTRFDSFWRTLPQRYGKACREMARGVRSSQGTLMGIRQERNENAERKEAEKANPDLFDAYEAAESQEERRIAAARIKKFIERRPRIYKNVEFPMGQCDGWGLLDGSKRPVMADVLARAIAAAERADDDKPIERWGKADFARMRGDLDELFAKVDEARKAVTELLRFASPANRERIADWAHQCGFDIEIQLPDGFGWPATPALDALSAEEANDHAMAA